MQDDDLRGRFDEWARPLRATQAPAVGELRSRIRRRTARIAAAAGSALAVIGLVAGLVVAGSLAAGRKPGGLVPQAQGSAKYPAPPGQPYVFVNSSATFVNTGNVPNTPAELKDAATGKVVKILRPVGQGVSFAAAAAAPGDRAFVLAQLDRDGTLSFAEIRISASGKPGALSLVMQYPHVCVTVGPCVPVLSLPAGTQAENMTVNAPVTRLSFFASTANGLSGSLVVYNLQTGTLIGSWPVTGNNDNASSQFVGNANELLVSVSSVEGGQNRIVDASAAFRAGSSLLADSRPGPANGFPGYFTQDGNMWINAEGANSTSSVVMMEVSSATGNLVRKIPIGPASAVNGPYYCGVLWASANGGELLTQCGTIQQLVVGGHITRIRLAWLLPSSLGSNTVAW
jgi:hypothetical protein